MLFKYRVSRNEFACVVISSFNSGAIEVIGFTLSAQLSPVCFNYSFTHPDKEMVIWLMDSKHIERPKKDR